MQWRNSLEKYGVVAKGFHWVIALLVIGLLAVGVYMAGMGPSPQKFELSFWHKSFGIVVLALVVLRVFWRVFNIHPRALSTHAGWERGLAKVAHGLLYLALFAMPLSGWVMASAKGYPVSVFGWFNLPHIVGPNDDLASLARTIHGVAGYGLIALIGLHVLGALKHHFIDRDATLRRMLPVLAVVMVMNGGAAMAADVPTWVMDKEKSTIIISGTQMGSPFQGEFKSFDGTITFAPDRLDESTADITIDMSQFFSGSTDRDGAVQGADWFDTKSYPTARFVVDRFEVGSETGAYIAHGTLTLRDTEMPVAMHFTLEIDGDVATANGEMNLNRLDYGVGAVWSKPRDVGTDVGIRVHVIARKG